MYADDYDGWVAPALTAGRRQTWSRMFMTKNYLPVAEVYRCPSHAVKVANQRSYIVNGWVAIRPEETWNYVWARHVRYDRACEITGPKSRSETPDRIALMMECWRGGGSIGVQRENTIDEMDENLCILFWIWNTGAYEHLGRPLSNVLFLDGHVTAYDYNYWDVGVLWPHVPYRWYWCTNSQFWF